MALAYERRRTPSICATVHSVVQQARLFALRAVGLPNGTRCVRGASSSVTCRAVASVRLRVPDAARSAAKFGIPAPHATLESDPTRCRQDSSEPHAPSLADKVSMERSLGAGLLWLDSDFSAPPARAARTTPQDDTAVEPREGRRPSRTDVEIYWYAPFNNADELDIARYVQTGDDTLVVQALRSRFGGPLPSDADGPFELFRDLPEPAGEDGRRPVRRNRLGVAASRAWRRDRLVHERQFDLLHIHTFNMFTDWFALPALRRSASAMVGTIHNVLPHDRRGPTTVERCGFTAPATGVSTMSLSLTSTCATCWFRNSDCRAVASAWCHSRSSDRHDRTTSRRTAVENSSSSALFATTRAYPFCWMPSRR